MEWVYKEQVNIHMASGGGGVCLTAEVIGVAAGRGSHVAGPSAEVHRVGGRFEGGGGGRSDIVDPPTQMPLHPLNLTPEKQGLWHRWPRNCGLYNITRCGTACTAPPCQAQAEKWSRWTREVRSVRDVVA